MTKQHLNATAFITDYDLHLFGEGTHYRIYEKLGAHITRHNGKEGTHFAVWAPNAQAVSVIGDFNQWDTEANRMQMTNDSGIWTAFLPGLKEGTLYKYFVKAKHGGLAQEKSDPFGFTGEVRPRTASMVWNLDKYEWKDQAWIEARSRRNALEAPMSIYEVHMGSWMLVPEEGNRWLTYRELADKLVPYLQKTNFTHVEFLPVSEHPLDASWGYQTTGYFATTSRFGSPQDFMYLVDSLHQSGFGVLLDWVPAHFPRDGHALGLFDGTHLYEHADPRQGEHREWGTYVFNYGRYEVRNFLISNALFWFDKYHIDGLRVDAVASMLYLDYARKEGEWVANAYGGRENIEAIEFLRKLNEVVYAEYPHALMIAEESTAWPQVARPTYLGGLGFGLKWDMGWMNDTLQYMSLDPVYRRYHHNKLTFRGIYQFSENFVLPLSHDEVVHGKGSLITKMPGDMWQKFANLRLLLGYQWSLPGKKLLFMGGEIGQWIEWNCHQSLDWHLLEYDTHRGIQKWVTDLNKLYVSETAMHIYDCQNSGFEWIDCQDSDQSVLVYMRKGPKPEQTIVIACNFTPVPRWGYRAGFPLRGFWREVLNSDATTYGGSGVGNFGGVWTDDQPSHAREQSAAITLPPLGVVMFKLEA
ncbi:MAG TPA: 1,4-alpha-glucan branching protein GlgB [Candidatus Obscuribacterales bacterium]